MGAAQEAAALDLPPVQGNRRLALPGDWGGRTCRVGSWAYGERGRPWWRWPRLARCPRSANGAGSLDVEGPLCDLCGDDLAESGMTVIVVTHERGIAREVDDSLVFMDGGVVIESGNPRDVLTTPQHDRTKAFLSKLLWAYGKRRYGRERVSPLPALPHSPATRETQGNIDLWLAQLWSFRE
ncbi:hypothetical protein GCM10010222_66150 [Streptomyces tanashiensis]|nr:hypothetical protein GCM10010222_66150 [Streptomyces tanashiensis]